MDPANPYRPPAATLAEPFDDSKLLFSVGTLKLALLSLCTLGLYQIYWFYQNWRRIRDLEGVDVTPALRAIFSVFFVYSFFRRISDRAKDMRVNVGWSPGTLATQYILLTFAARLPDPLWLVTFLTFIPMLRVQKTMALLNAPHGPAEPWSKLSGLNWLGISLGGLMLVFLVLVAFLGEPVE